jgi:thiol-disulfide isomerase/thioredoxin
MKFSTRHFIACTLTGILLTATACSQELKIGQACPEVLLKNMINYHQAEARLSDFKSSLLILDFWGTGCLSCIQSFPKIDSLQKKFNGRVQFIAVNKESLDSTLRFFERKRRIQKPAIPFVTGDTALSALFPHVYVPHHVWIDSAGIVRYITDGYNATEEHIQQFLNGSDLSMNEKKYEAKDDYDSPLKAIADKKGLDHLESYSLLLHCISGMSFGNAAGIATENNHSFRLTQNCVSVAELYSVAFSENGKHDFSNANTVILEVKNKSRYVYPQDNNLKDEWVSNHSYIYELMIPAAEAAFIYQKMRQDLVRYFNLKGIIEKRKVRCMTLVRTTVKDYLKTKGSEPASNFWVTTDAPVRYILNQSFDRFVSALSIQSRHFKLDQPFIDKTNYTNKIDIQISTDALDNFDVKKLNSELKKYGLALQEQEILREVLVLRKAE